MPCNVANVELVTVSIHSGAQLLGRHAQITKRGRQPHVSENDLHVAEVSAPAEHVRRTGRS